MPTQDTAENWLTFLLSHSDGFLFFALGGITVYWWISKGYLAVPSIVKQMSIRDDKIARMEERLIAMEERLSDIEPSERLKDALLERATKKMLSDTGTHKHL